ncbi:MAG TPA: deoxyribonuclease IV [Bacteroidota bacterium]|nr:deoxyribonuclease IV [Bacteroidota bacterium]
MVGRNSAAESVLLGAHESVAGGIYRAVERAASIGATALQVFTKNSNRWEAPPLTREDAENYKTALSKSSVRSVIAHDSYLINLCAIDPVILRKSRKALIDEIRRCDMLGIGMLNFHPGAHMGAGEEAGITLIVESLDIAHRETRGAGVLSVVETTAGQGTALGSRFEQIAAIIAGVRERDRMGVCIDTCHIFAAGYDIRDAASYGRVMGEFGDIVGFDRLRAIHVNDSRSGLGSRVDRHAHIGEGHIGKAGFGHIMNDPRLKDVPKILETPKGDDLAEDRVNMQALRKLVRKKIRGSRA